ncbi:MAG: deoxyribodipyrimidine photo-lyase, partial [Actinobacteria bacterium]|nr:deoxyribodipyrimidine photo-lyase [Actinomycetota bacterium]
MSSAVVVFTRDLRLHDHPALRAATAATAAVPLFVFDDAILSGRFNRPNRTQYLLQSLTDLDGSLRARGGRLVVRRGGWVAEVLGAAREAGAATVHVSDDVTPFARRRLAALEAAGAGVGVGVVRHP